MIAVGLGVVFVLICAVGAQLLEQARIGRDIDDERGGR